MSFALSAVKRMADCFGSEPGKVIHYLFCGGFETDPVDKPNRSEVGLVRDHGVPAAPDRANNVF